MCERERDMLEVERLAQQKEEARRLQVYVMVNIIFVKIQKCEAMTSQDTH